MKTLWIVGRWVLFLCTARLTGRPIVIRDRTALEANGYRERTAIAAEDKIQHVLTDGVL